MTYKGRRRKNIRLPGYDYASAGAYLVTICTRGRALYFEDTCNKQFAEQIWHDLPQRFPSVRLDAFAVLPNHIHGILWLEPTETHHPKLEEVICAYKSLVYRLHRKNLLVADAEADTRTLWQRSYNDRIIRVEKSLELARLYVFNNYEKHVLLGDFLPEPQFVHPDDILQAGNEDDS
jgi:putative transposase